MKIRTQISLTSLAMVAVPCLVMGGLSIWSLRSTSADLVLHTGEAMRKEAEQTLLSGARRDRELVEAMLRQAEGDARGLADSTALRSFLSGRGGVDQKLIDRGLSGIATGVSAMGASVDGQVDIAKQMMQMAIEIAQIELKSQGGVALSGAEVAFKAVNQVSRQESDVRLPSMTLGGKPIPLISSMEEFAPIVDPVGARTGVLCTLFQRMDAVGNMLRIATNVANADGGRAIGTFIPAQNPDGKPNPVVAKVLAGDPYDGAAWVVDRWCDTAYRPLRDAKGAIVGMIFVGMSLQDMKGLMDSVLARHLDATGYGAMVEPGGRLAVHPRKDLLNKHLLDDLKLEPFRELLTAAVKPGETRAITYVLEGKAKYAVWTRTREWNWAVLYAGLINDIIQQGVAEARTAHVQEVEQLYRGSCVLIAGESRPLYNQIRLLDAKGMELICLQKGKLVGTAELKDKSGMAWFQAASKAPAGSFYIHPIEVAANTGKPELRLCVPVHQEGKLLGMTVLSVDWELVWLQLKTHVYGKTGYSYLLDDRGFFLSHPKFTLRDQVNAGAVTGDMGAVVREHMLPGEEGVACYRFEEVDKYVAYVPVKLGANRLIAVATAPVSEVMAAADEAKKVSASQVNRALLLEVVAAGLVCAFGLVLALRLGRRFSQPVQQTEAALAQLATGDLTGRMVSDRQDEFGAMAGSFNHAIEAMGDATRRIAGNAQSITGQAGSMAAVADQLGTGAAASASQAAQAAEQARQVTGITTALAAAVEELGSSVQEIARSAAEAATKAGEGAKAGTEASGGMQQLAALGQEIGVIVQVITGIAEQVNLLSLNAAIEAASAGEAGRGFAVVASEIKTLARRVQDASEDIAGKIQRIQDGVAGNVAAVEHATALVRDIDSLQQSMAAATEQQASTTKEMAAHIHEAASGVERIAGAADALAAATSGTDALAARSRAASQDLARLAMELKEAVGRFRT